MGGSYAALSGDDGTDEPLLGERKNKTKKKRVKQDPAGSSDRKPVTRQEVRPLQEDLFSAPLCGSDVSIM